MGEMTQSVDVDVDVRTAYNQWTQFEEFPQFMDGVERVEQIDDTHLFWEVEIAGVERKFEAEIPSRHRISESLGLRDRAQSSRAW